MDQSLENFVREHGHSFHARVAKKLRDSGWTVAVSPFYRDNATDKAREVDLIAEKEIKFGMDGSATVTNGFFRVRLIIECKYAKGDTIFWFDEKDLNGAERRIMKDISLFKPSIHNVSTLKHHWRSSEQAAKLFATYHPNSQEKQSENEIVFSAIDKVLNCLINYRSQPSIVKNKSPEGFCLYAPIIHYPMIVFNDFTKFHETTIDEPDSINAISRGSNFEIEVNYEYVRYVAGMKQNIPEYFLVDVVDFTKFEDYLKILKDKDLLAALNYL